MLWVRSAVHLHLCVWRLLWFIPHSSGLWVTCGFPQLYLWVTDGGASLCPGLLLYDGAVQAVLVQCRVIQVLPFEHPMQSTALMRTGAFLVFSSIVSNGAVPAEITSGG